MAAGHFDGYWEMISYPWDIAAGTLMAIEAGGAVSQADGNLLNIKRATSVVATNGKIHAELIGTLAN